MLQTYAQRTFLETFYIHVGVCLTRIMDKMGVSSRFPPTGCDAAPFEMLERFRANVFQCTDDASVGMSNLPSMTIATHEWCWQ